MCTCQWRGEVVTSLKKWICTVSNFIDLLYFHLICQMLAKFCGLNPKGPYVSLEKEKENICVLLTYSLKWACEIRKLHVTVMQQWLRNVQKAGCTCKDVFLPIKTYCFFCCLPSPLQNSPSSRNIATMVT